MICSEVMRHCDYEDQRMEPAWLLARLCTTVEAAPEAATQGKASRCAPLHLQPYSALRFDTLLTSADTMEIKR